jgi:hypothetical protein
VNHLDIWQDSLDDKSARRRTSAYTGQHNTVKGESVILDDALLGFGERFGETHSQL